MCRVDSWIFKWRLHFLIQIIAFLIQKLQKTGGFAASNLQCTGALVEKLLQVKVRERKSI